MFFIIDANTDHYYTGRAGQAFFGERHDRFGYRTREEAERRAAQINRFTDIHGRQADVIIDEAAE